MGKTHTSMQGKEVDMEKMALRNELSVAVGNMKVNARGDELGAGGQIVRTREQILQDYYKNNSRSVSEDGIPSRKK